MLPIIAHGPPPDPTRSEHQNALQLHEELHNLAAAVAYIDENRGKRLNPMVLSALAWGVKRCGAALPYFERYLRQLAPAESAHEEVYRDALERAFLLRRACGAVASWNEEPDRWASDVLAGSETAVARKRLKDWPFLHVLGYGRRERRLRAEFEEFVKLYCQEHPRARPAFPVEEAGRRIPCELVAEANPRREVGQLLADVEAFCLEARRLPFEGTIPRGVRLGRVPIDFLISGVGKGRSHEFWPFLYYQTPIRLMTECLYRIDLNLERMDDRSSYLRAVRSPFLRREN